MLSNEKVGTRISTLRKEKQLSQEQLAEQLNVSAQAVSKWETGKSLPETATLPLLSAVLGHSIDSILMPQQLVVLYAAYTDGHENHDVTHFINQFVIGNHLALTVNEQTFPSCINSSRIKLLLIKYQIPSGTYTTYVLQDSLLVIDLKTEGYAVQPRELEFVFASYGNEQINRNVLGKMKHYQYFKWEHFTANHELFPSLIENNGNDYLSLVYINTTGIHAISCPEGDRIHYTPDRTHLFRSDALNDHYIVENVGRLGFGQGMDCSWAGALYLSLKTMGQETTYETVMGVSGACWRIAFTPIWDYSSADGLVAYDYASLAFKAYGLQVSWADRIPPEQRKLEKQAVMASIRKHQLPIAINLRVAPEWGVITGYIDGGNTLLCRSYFDEETFIELKDDPEFREHMKMSKGYLNVDQWPYLLIRFNGESVKPSTLDSLYASLQVKLDSMKARESRGYTLGYQGLQEWQEGLLDEQWYQLADDQDFSRRLGVNHFCLMALTDARRSAADYLNHSCLSMGTSPTTEYLSQMTAVYKEMYSQLQNFQNSLTNPNFAATFISSPKQAWTKEQRQLQADLFQSIIALEHRGDKLAKRILEVR
ncbi:helix-turn-helix domain-containing protein [Paenibacillus monticola]|uniref:Helix-turn-helix domain-containing protein n=1 Tax=Paenibacillus monticola TaxID=2666075 RepID=A0A7X2HC39_9BACL|nr:helix-turn-helix transcriptional regulator [Paenibacillus monticola]MRN56673.1 helix-turn-helix domain-containing protein [Paenibacillus monticola]